MKTFRPFFVIVAFVLIVGLACAFGKGNPQQTPQNRPTVEQPTAEQSTTEQPTPEAQATTQGTTGSATGTPDAQNLGDYFTDTFDGNMDNYTVENRKKGSDTSKMKVSIKDGAMVLNLQGNNLWVYVTYKLFKYTDVKISMTVDNRGKSNNNVTLFCRQSSEGWYEFNIANNGSYWIYAYDAADEKYNTLFNADSKESKQGKDTNEYTASCVGENLTLSINGVEVKTIKEAKYKFREGTVGFGVSSFNTVPILVNIDSFTVSQP